MTNPTWQEGVYAALKAARIAQIGYVPDAGHAHLIQAAHADPAMQAIVLTTECPSGNILNRQNRL